jgi:hypothetical protein
MGLATRTAFTPLWCAPTFCVWEWLTDCKIQLIVRALSANSSMLSALSAG